MDYSQDRKRVYDAAMNLCRYGLIRLSAGNISQRIDSHLAAITPTSVAYDVLKPEDISIITLDGELVDGPFKPSSETALHTAIYRDMPEMGGVVHTHSIYSMTFAAAGKSIPLVNVECLSAHSDGAIPLAPYVSPGSKHAGEVAVAVFRANPGLKAFLLRNHGLVVRGPDVETAWVSALNIEIGAQVAYQALTLGQANALSAEQVKEIFEIYGIRK